MGGGVRLTFRGGFGRSCRSRGRWRIESFDGVVTFDGCSGTPPFTVPDSVLVPLERCGVSEGLVNAPHQGVLRRGHSERDASIFGAREFDMTGEMGRDEIDFLVVSAHESSPEKNLGHELIVGRTTPAAPAPAMRPSASSPPA